MWLFTGRHEYEPVLVAELARMGAAARTLLPGLVAAELGEDPPERWDPVYALQVLPQVGEVRGESIRQLAQAVADYCVTRWPAGAGRFAVHVLVPGQLKGQPNPQMRRRADLLQAALPKMLINQLPAPPSRSAAVDRLVQVLLLDPEVAYVSVAPLRPVGGAMCWPSHLPAGLADPADEPTAPSSAFRKLREALACMAEAPGPGSQTVDLGASPGGWSHVLRQLGAEVTAVDRAELAPALMKDKHIQFIAADAFAWRPPRPVDWIVSDIIAYPERVPDLLQVWCGGALADRLVIQMKFKGWPDFDLIGAALRVCSTAGYFARAKHFFNDKHEITLMAGRQVATMPAEAG
ncbi:MAG: hypothetical protein HY902_18910 [Deltaproteobacteria bacterium]|nr:hypothetical protein [Deltaproteobacteria bacterium]